MGLLASQFVVLTYGNFEFTSDEIVDNFDITLDQLSITFWCDFFKQAFASSVNANIPALCAIANAVFDPLSEFAREFTLVHPYGRVTLSIRLK